MQYLSFIKAESLELNLKCLSAFLKKIFKKIIHELSMKPELLFFSDIFISNIHLHVPQ